MTPTTTRTNDEAIAAYMQAQREAREALAAITRYLDAHQDAVTPEEIDWGHVGDIRQIVAELGALGDPA